MEIRDDKLQENWIKYNKLNIDIRKVSVSSATQNLDGTEIILDNEKNENVIKIFFGGMTPMVRISNEGIRMRTWGEVQRKYNNKYFFNDWFLYKVENSKLTKWALEESCGFYEESELVHYCIVTFVDLVDILASFEPEITIDKDFIKSQEPLAQNYRDKPKQ